MKQGDLLVSEEDSSAKKGPSSQFCQDQNL